VREPDELRAFMPRALSERFFPGLGRHFYPAPVSEFRADALLGGAASGLQQNLGGTKSSRELGANGPGAPGSDPATLRRHVLEEAGASHAVLVPLTRGLLPDRHVVNAICQATNQWLVERWLDPDNEDGRLRGSIRVNPADPEHALREIERWSGHPAMVQVAVPLESHAPYGQSHFQPVWEAAAACGLKVAVVAERANGVEFAPTPRGFPTHHIEFVAQKPLAYLYHLASLMAEGVFDRIRGLRVVFCDGGIDMLMPIVWRFDAGWRPSRSEVPWMGSPPSAYLAEHVRLCSSAQEGPADPQALARWLEIAAGEQLLMYASHYPFRQKRLADRFRQLPDAVAAAVLSGNAGDTYGLELLAAHVGE
jgi:predicted TIM-barrel fold metal-dependent hydrolase